ncbi:MAG: hypothetical protein ACKVPX_11780 [Myxococcaceae bacterium]
MNGAVETRPEEGTEAQSLRALRALDELIATADRDALVSVGRFLKLDASTPPPEAGSGAWIDPETQSLIKRVRRQRPDFDSLGPSDQAIALHVQNLREQAGIALSTVGLNRALPLGSAPTPSGVSLRP